MVMADEAWTGRWADHAHLQGRRAARGNSLRVARARSARVSGARPVRVCGGRPARVAGSNLRWMARNQPVRAARAGLAPRLHALVRPLGSVWVLGPALVGMAVLAALVLVYLHVACLDTGHRILALEKELQTLQAENERLQLEVLRLGSPARVEQVARAKLEMVPAQVTRVVAAPPVQVRAAAPAATSWLEQVASYLAEVLEGRGVLAGPAR